MSHNPVQKIGVDTEHSRKVGGSIFFGGFMAVGERRKRKR